MNGRRVQAGFSNFSKDLHSSQHPFGHFARRLRAVRPSRYLASFCLTLKMTFFLFNLLLNCAQLDKTIRSQIRISQL